jgi:prophage regulatory protein
MKPQANVEYTNDLDRLITDIEVAKLFSISRETVWRWAKIGRISSPVKIGGSTRWRLSDLQRMIREAE